jgi:hypothetical protein
MMIVLLYDEGWELTDEVLPRAKSASLAAYRLWLGYSRLRFEDMAGVSDGIRND